MITDLVVSFALTSMSSGNHICHVAFLFVIEKREIDDSEDVRLSKRLLMRTAHVKRLDFEFEMKNECAKVIDWDEESECDGFLLSLVVYV